LPFLKLGAGTHLRTGLIVSAEVREDGGVLLEMLIGSEPIDLTGSQARAFIRWLVTNASKTTDGVFNARKIRRLRLGEPRQNGTLTHVVDGVWALPGA